MMRCAWYTGAAVWVALSAACSGGQPTSPDEELFDLPNGQEAFRGTANKTALTAAELSNYVQDRAYLRGLVSRGRAAQLNHADPRQHRFALARLKLAGKTQENSPQLYRQLEQLRAKHEAKQLTVASLAPSDSVTGGRENQHAMATTSITAAPSGVKSGALASRMDPLDYGYVDNATWDDLGNPLGDMNFVEIFGSMPYMTVQSNGTLANAQGPSLEGDSFLTETVSATGELRDSYVVGLEQPAVAPALAVPVVQHPLDSNRDGFITICLERTDTVDCDYNNVGWHQLIVPLKGSVSVSTPGVVIDWTAITASYQTGMLPGGDIYATLGTNGGGCQLPAAGQGISSMKSFWSHVTRSPTVNPTTISWDLYNNGDATTWANFSQDCQLIQAQVYVTMDLQIPYVNNNNGSSGVLPTTISNAVYHTPLQSPPNLNFQPALRITNSCLAAGTLVTVPGSAPRKIEDVQIGDRVANPYLSSVTVVDTTIGTERTPMVRIRDDHGRTLLMTEMHPLVVVDRGMVPAKLLRVGDRVKTDDGSSSLVEVSRESYAGQVFNLKVGNAEEAHALGADQTAMYANGFLVGDSQIQTRLDFAERAGTGAAVRRDVTPEWRADYQTSLRRATRR